MTLLQIKSNLINIKTIKQFKFKNGFKNVKINYVENIDIVQIFVTSDSGKAISKGINPKIDSESDGANSIYMAIEFFDANSLTYAVHRLTLSEKDKK